MQKIHQLHECFLRLVLSGNISKAFAGSRLHINLGVALAKAHSVAAHALAHKIHEQLPQGKENQNRHNPVGEERHNWALLSRHNLRKLYLALHQPVCQLRVLYTAGNVNLFFIVLIDGGQTLIGNLNLRHLAFINHLDKAVIRNILHLRIDKGWHDNRINH